MDEKETPQKLFFTIGEVSSNTKIKPHVLRYWESEFKLLTPQKNSTGQRVYRQKDIDVILAIKRLLYQEKFTIAGAKKQLRTEMEAKAEQQRQAKKNALVTSALTEIKTELNELKEMLIVK